MSFFILIGIGLTISMPADYRPTDNRPVPYRCISDANPCYISSA